MAKIDINFTELKRNYMIANETNNNLNTLFLETNKQLQSICNAINCTELTEVTSNVIESISNITKSNVECLNNINEFLKTQINSYETTSEIAKKSIEDLNSKIESSLSNIKVTSFYSGNING